MLANFMMQVPQNQQVALAMMNLASTEVKPVSTFDLDALTSPADRKFNLEGNNSNYEFTLSENPTTGYTWTADTSKCGARLTEVKSEYLRDANGAEQMGVGGSHHWIFKTPDPAENYVRGLPCDITFNLARPWEKQNGPV